MSKEIPDLSEMRSKYSDLQKENLEMHSRLEVLNNELTEKNNILKKTNAEHAELQKLYRDSLDKIVELSKKTSDRRLSPEEERIYRLQLAEQASCISTLQDRLWDSENQRRQAILYGMSSNSSSSCSDQMQQIHSTSNTKYYNYTNHEIDCSNISNYRRPSFCDPIPNIDKAEKKIISLHHKLLECSKQNDFLLNELKAWSKFVMQIFNIASEAINEYPAFPDDDPCNQRKVTLNVVCKLAKANNETSKVYDKYACLKERYQELKNYLSTIEKRCNHLSQVTQLKTITNNNNFVDLNSDFNDDDFSYYQKVKSFKSRNGSNKPRPKYQIEDSEIDINQTNRKIYSRSKYDEKKTENCSKKHYISNDTEFDSFSDDQNENLNYNRKSYYKKSEYIKNDSDFSLSDHNKQKFDKITPNQIKRQQKIIKTDETKRTITPNNYKQSVQNSKISFNNHYKHKTNEKNTQTSFNNTYPQQKPNVNEDSDDLYSNLGANISRLSKITKDMKNNYYDFAKYAKEIDTESFSVEEISKTNSH